jgi:hypothetical protein
MSASRQLGDDLLRLLDGAAGNDHVRARGGKPLACGYADTARAADYDCNFSCERN